jgi:hypothetical protein
MSIEEAREIIAEAGDYCECKEDFYCYYCYCREQIKNAENRK